LRPVVYDAGVLVAAERSERRLWAEHRVRLEMGFAPIVPSPVVAQVSRSPKQVQLRRLLSGCRVVTLDDARAHRVGALLGKSRTADVVDASVVALAIEHDADIVTGDRADIELLLQHVRGRTRVFAI
jgi:hypothetical protein